jgi:hypothetical protein
MGYYLNPASEETILENGGRRLVGSDYEKLASQLNHGEVIVALYDRYMFKQIPALYSKDEFEAFESQYRSGSINRLGFYAVNASVFGEGLTKRLRT